MSVLYYESSISHHGTKGQKWGRRLYQNPDGSLTRLGRLRYLGDVRNNNRKMTKVVNKEQRIQRKIALEKLKVDEQLKTAKAQSELDSAKKELSNLTKKTETTSNPSKVVNTITGRPDIKSMSNQELNDYINRIRLEKTLSELTSKPKKEMSPFMKEVSKTVLTSIGTEMSKAIGTRIINAGKSQLDSISLKKEAAKLKDARDREDFVWQRDRDAVLKDAETKRMYEIDKASTEATNEYNKIKAQWDWQRMADIEDRDFYQKNPDMRWYMESKSKGQQGKKKGNN